MHAARIGHTATLLDDGRILIAGGQNSVDAALGSAEIYDPGSGKFSLTGSMSTARSSHSACLLKTGQVLVAAGWDASNPQGPLNSAELYDPATGSFSKTAYLRELYPGTTSAVELPDGRALVVGDLPTAEIYWP